MRVDAQLKAAFAKAAAAERRPPAELVQSFMQAYVRRSQRRGFEAEALRQSRESALQAQDPASDEYTVMAEIEAELADVWGDS